MFKKTLSVFLGVVAFVDEAFVAGLAEPTCLRSARPSSSRLRSCHCTSSPINPWISSPQQVRLASSGHSRYPHFSFPLDAGTGGFRTS
jgi:hypothetical protein